VTASYPGASEVFDTRAKAYGKASQSSRGTNGRQRKKHSCASPKYRVEKEAPEYKAGNVIYISAFSMCMLIYVLQHLKGNVNS